MIPDLTVVWVILFVLLLAGLLNRLLFSPIVRTVRERQERVKSAMDLAQASSEKARQVSAEFERRTFAAQAEVYHEMDGVRRVALARRDELLAATRQDVETSLKQATQTLHGQVADARHRLEQDADALANAVVERVLDRKAS